MKNLNFSMNRLDFINYQNSKYDFEYFKSMKKIKNAQVQSLIIQDQNSIN